MFNVQCSLSIVIRCKCVCSGSFCVLPTGHPNWVGSTAHRHLMQSIIDLDRAMSAFVFLSSLSVHRMKCVMEDNQASRWQSMQKHKERERERE